MRHNFNKFFNLYINFKFTKFLTTIYILLCIKFFKNLSNPYISIFNQILRQQTICLKNKNGLKSILVRRFFGHFLVFLKI